MQYQATTPEAYLEELPEDWRKAKLLQVRDMIRANGPELEERIEYKMLGYGTKSTTVFHLNAQKAHVSLYVGDINKIDSAWALLKNFSTGKGCVRIAKHQDPLESDLETFITRVLDTWRAGGDISC